MQNGTVSFSAEERADGLHIEGVVTTEDGRRVPFVGWLALLAALEAVVTDGAAPMPVPHSTDGSR